MLVDIPNKGQLYIDETLKNNLDNVKDSVLNKNWDYFAVIAGIPGVGKSTLAQQLATYLDPTFNNDRICFSAKEYIEKSNQMKKGEAIMLDESFADMNANVTRSPEFVALLNHIQKIRQKNLFHILILPDFFSLSKNIAIFRTSHLFVVYHEDYKRGRFAVFDREAKRELYIKGKQFINYQAVEPNLRAKYTLKWFVDYAKYEQDKLHNLEKGEVKPMKKHKWCNQRDALIRLLFNEYKVSETAIGKACGMEQPNVSKVVLGLDAE